MVMRILIQFVCLLMVSVNIAQANLPISDVDNHTERQLERIYQLLNEMDEMDMATRLAVASKVLLGKPYQLNALGEGEQGLYDKFPLYRLDAFDCETFVDTVMALALGANPQVFKQCINQIRYRKGQPNFLLRNHFASLDWNINNQRKGFLKDITNTITNQKGQPVADTAKALISKPGWYQQMKSERIRIQGLSDEEQLKRLDTLKNKGKQLETVQAIIPYIPLSILFNDKGQAQQLFFDQIPNGAIIEIIRPDWNLKEKIGTNLNVSHLGFAFWEHGRLLFREASSTHHQTIDVLLVDYLRNALKSPTIKGINIQVVVPSKPLEGQCIPFVPNNKLQRR